MTERTWATSLGRILPATAAAVLLAAAPLAGSGGEPVASPGPGAADLVHPDATSPDATSPTPAVDATPAVDERWLPWLGCWEPVHEAPEPEGMDEGAQEEGPTDVDLVCFRPAPDVGVLIQGVTDGQVVSEEPLVADGEDWPVARAGCEGMERARWSDDGHRLFLHSELDCSAGVTRIQTSVLAFDTPHEWVEVQSIEATGADASAGVRRFRAVDDAVVQAMGLPPAVDPEKALAVETTRRAAAAPLGLDEVREAAELVHPEAVKVLLLERDVRLALDARSLVELDDAGVSGEVIDLMVALAHPEHFDIDPEARRASPQVAERPDRVRPGPYRVVGIDPFWYGPFHRPFGFFGRYPYHFHSTWGLGARFGGVYGSFGRVVVVPVERRERLARAVRGQGYTQGNQRPGTTRQASPRSGSEGAAARDRPPRRTNPPSAGSAGDRSRVTPQGATRGDRGSSSNDDRSRRARSRSGGGGGS